MTKHHRRLTIKHIIKRMADEIKSIIVKPNRIPLKIMLRILVILFITGIVFFSLKYFPKRPNSPVKPNPQVNSSSLDTCSLSKEGNPLVETLSTQAGLLQGNFKGKISYLEKDPVRQSYIIKLKSLDNSQEYKFNIRTSLSELKVDQIVKLSFVCNTQTNLLDFDNLTIIPAATSSAKKVK